MGRALAAVVEDTDVFARVNPAQKNRLIRALKRNCHVVGYIGAGINDAPSLHSADVGISVAPITIPTDNVHASCQASLLRRQRLDRGLMPERRQGLRAGPARKPQPWTNRGYSVNEQSALKPLPWAVTAHVIPTTC